MAYTKTTWTNSSAPAINANNLNKIENALYDIDNRVEGLTDAILNLVYPVGCYYWSSEATDPSELFGGTWEQVKDKFVLALGDTYPTAGATGGSATHTLTVQEMPSHTHTQNPHSHVEHSEIYANINGTKFNTASGSGLYFNTVSQGGRAQISTNNATATNQNTGGGQAFDIMPPYEVAYCWKRTA